MRNMLVLLGSLVVLTAPVAAFAADPTPAASSLANQSCKTQQSSMTAAAFGSLYTNFGRCVTKALGTAQGQLTNAATTCKKQQADPGFAAAHGGQTFDQLYGTKGNGASADANAYGKCVSQTARAANGQSTSALVSAAQKCRAAQKANPAAFASRYRTFGKCVSTSV